MYSVYLPPLPECLVTCRVRQAHVTISWSLYKTQYNVIVLYNYLASGYMITILHGYISVLNKDGAFIIMSPMVFHNVAPIYI